MGYNNFNSEGFFTSCIEHVNERAIQCCVQIKQGRGEEKDSFFTPILVSLIKSSPMT
jgi:hypothetical protein